MNNKLNKLCSIILPHKKTNIFVLSIIIIGVSLGAIYLNIISINDQNIVIEKIKSFISNINTNSLNSILLLKNSISINLIYILLIFILGFTLIGSIIGLILLLIKSFIIGFTISSFILTYKYKGLIISTLYLVFGELLNIFIIFILSIYAITFTIKITKLIFNKEDNKKISKFLKNYLIIFIISLVLSLISSLLQSFVIPAILKLIIKLYI